MREQSILPQKNLTIKFNTLKSIPVSFTFTARYLSLISNTRHLLRKRGDLSLISVTSKQKSSCLDTAHFQFLAWCGMT